METTPPVSLFDSYLTDPTRPHETPRVARVARVARVRTSSHEFARVARVARVARIARIARIALCVWFFVPNVFSPWTIDNYIQKHRIRQNNA